MFSPGNFIPNDDKVEYHSINNKESPCKRNYRSSNSDIKPLQKQAKYQPDFQYSDPSYMNFDDKHYRSPMEVDDFTEFYYKEPFSNRSMSYNANKMDVNDAPDEKIISNRSINLMADYRELSRHSLRGPQSEYRLPKIKKDPTQMMFENHFRDNIGNDREIRAYDDIGDTEVIAAYDNIGDTEVVEVNDNIGDRDVEASPMPRQSLKRVNVAALSVLDEEMIDELNSSSIEEGEIRETENLVVFPEYDARQSLQFIEMDALEPGNFVTPQLGWKKVFEKYSPSTEVLHSPIRPLEANLKPNVSTDYQIYALVWVVSMSEQFYYDNSITLLYKYHTEPQKLNDVLTANSRIIDYDYILESMVEIVILGSGSFGEVYRVKQRDTGEYFAIKYLKKTESKAFYEHTSVILDYLSEKNSLIKARNSPFVVQFLRSITFPSVEGLFLIFEWCLCDLRKYMVILAKVIPQVITNGLWDGLEYGIDEVLIYAYSQYDEDYFTVTLIYIFELFCALDFLAKCNIVHQDLKPENIMIGTNFHLKIADFGLVYNTKFITRDSQINLVDASNINVVESSNYKPVWGGTQSYEDMELCYRQLLKKDKAAAYNIASHPDRVNPLFSSVYQDHNPDFLSDLWACGIIATELLLANTHFLYPLHLSRSLKQEMNVTNSFCQSVLAITYINKNYKRYVKAGLKSFGGEENVDLMHFLASIFKPRIKRAKKFVKEKEIYRYKNKVRLYHIDINKVEKLSVFDSMGITSNNVFLYKIPDGMGMLLDKKYQMKFQTLRHLLISKLSSDHQLFFKFEPGIPTQFI